MRCSITQPTFLPWLGWFDLIDNVDVVVLLDTVQFEKRSWQQRNRIKTTTGLKFLTVPVQSAGRFEQKIHEVRIADDFSTSSILGKIKNSYCDAPYFSDTFEHLEVIFKGTHTGDKLLSLNLRLIEYFAYKLNIKTPLIKASELKAIGKRGEYLANICSEIRADTYVSTLGAKDYLLEDLRHFVKNNIDVFMYQYKSPIYPQLHTPFEYMASVLDLVMMAGPKSGQIMRSGLHIFTELTCNR